jgi:hypothetical protein
VGKRSRRRRQGAPPEKATGTEYTDPEGNALVLRDRLSAGTHKLLDTPQGPAAASLEDLAAREGEILFEQLAMSWTIAGLPISKQKELLGRYRMASAEERTWVNRTIAEHLERAAG